MARKIRAFASHHNAAAGIIAAIIASATFGTAGTFGKSMLNSGWSPLAAVIARIGLAAIVLAIPTFLLMRHRMEDFLANKTTIILYGIFGVAGGQWAHFNAIQHVSVGVALLLEYLAPTLLVGYAWLRTGRLPRPLTVAGAIVSLFGLALVLDVFTGLNINMVGVLWGLLAALCGCGYFIISAKNTDNLPPIALAGGGMAVGSLLLLAMAVGGLQPVVYNANNVLLAGMSLPIWVPVIGLAVIAAAISYTAGIWAARSLGETTASFVSLIEVMFAVAFAWVFLAQQPSLVQALGGVTIIAGIVLVRLGEMNDGPDDPMTNLVEFAETGADDLPSNPNVSFPTPVSQPSAPLVP